MDQWNTSGVPFGKRLRRGLASISARFTDLVVRTNPPPQNSRAQRMCPFCGLITPRFQRSCVECGKSFGGTQLEPNNAKQG
jgi:hypothetical protein